MRTPRTGHLIIGLEMDLYFCYILSFVLQIKLYFVFVYLNLIWYLGAGKSGLVSIEFTIFLCLFLFSLTLSNWNILYCGIDLSSTFVSNSGSNCASLNPKLVIHSVSTKLSLH